MYLQSSVRGETVRNDAPQLPFLSSLQLSVVRLERQIPREHFNKNPAKRAGIFLFTFLFHFPTSSFDHTYFGSRTGKRTPLSEHPRRTPAQPFVSYLFPLFHPDNLIFCTPVATPASNDDKRNSRRRLDVCFHPLPFKRCM